MSITRGVNPFVSIPKDITMKMDKDMSIRKLHAQAVDKVMSPSETKTEVHSIRDTDDGPYWGKELGTEALGNTRINC